MRSKNRPLKLTNLDKIFWPKNGYTKGDVIAYYESIGKIILPYLINRPMVLNRHPNGIDGESFFQKQIDAHAPAWIERTTVLHQQKKTTYLMVQNIETLLYVANLGCIELNPFHSQIPHLENPSFMVLDLDPEKTAFDKVIEVAISIRELLIDIGMNCYCKTSGGRGLHIYVPLGAKYDFDQSQKLAHLIALIIESRHKDLVSLERLPKNRQRRIYIDFLRNSIHQTLCSAYSLRPRSGAPVSTPLDWSELRPGLDPLDYNIETTPARLKEIGDIFKPVLKRGINMKKSLELLYKIAPNFS
jgi:bifunctional non-homologous end joining protein LigD